MLRSPPVSGHRVFQRIGHFAHGFVRGVILPYAAVEIAGADRHFVFIYLHHNANAGIGADLVVVAAAERRDAGQVGLGEPVVSMEGPEQKA